MIRLTATTPHPGEVVLKVEGWVAGAGVGTLESEGVCHLQADQHLVLDLDGVRFIDREGLALLWRWVDQGVVLRGGSLFVHELLRIHGLLSDGPRASRLAANKS